MEDEVARAAQLGWDVSRTGEETVSGQDYAAMLDYFVTAVNPSKSGEWGEMFPDFRALTDSISRAEAFTALSLAAEVVGGDYLGLQRTDELFALDEQIGEPWDNYPVRWELFDEAYLEEPSSHVPEEKWTRFATGYFYAMGRYSAFSGERIFSYDSDTNSMRPEADLTYMEALLSVARLFVSAAYGRVTDRVVTQEDAALLAQADELRESIRSSESQYTVGEGGTVYYVSPDGDDGNDGKSPETAWRTLDKVNSAAASYYYLGESDDSAGFPEFQWALENPDSCAVLEPGDVVLFRRGGQWRGVLRTVTGVTYSAYGEGDKPEILCSPENGTGAEKWTLVEGTDNIWKFYKQMQDCGGIMLERGEEYTVAAKHAAFWDGTRYINVGQAQTSYPMDYVETCPELDVTRHLDDLWFFNDIRYKDGNIDYGAFGDLYLRCDEGNPGEVYASVEFFTGNNSWNENAVKLRDDVTIDNLCIRYFLGAADAQHAENATVRSCMFLWGGGFMLGYQQSGDSVSFSRAGDGIMIGGQSNTAVNNYVAHTFDWGITIEGYSDNPDETWEEKYRYDCTVSGNLVEHCAGGILMVDWNAWNTAQTGHPMFSGITIRDNYVMHTGGGGWTHAEDLEAGETYLSALGLYLNPGCSDIVCSGNVFYETWAIGQLIRIGRYEDSAPVELSGNTYAQKNMGKFCQLLIRNTAEDGVIQEDFIEVLYDMDAAAGAAVLGDTSAAVLAPAPELPVPVGAASIQMNGGMMTAAGEGAVLWLAQYDGEKMLLDVRRAEPVGGQILVFPLADTRQMLLLCLNEQLAPQAEAVRVSLEEMSGTP